MSIFKQAYNFITNADYDAYQFDVERYASTTDYVHDCGIIFKTIYVPALNLYTHYYSDMKRFIVYKSEKPFDENDSKYKNMRKIKVSARFCFDMADLYEMDEHIKSVTTKNKEYFDTL